MSLTAPKDNTDPALHNLMQTRVGFGKAQYKIMSSMYAGNLVKGAMNLTLAILLPIVRQLWALSTLQESIGLSVIYAGMTVGILVQVLSDRLGRKKMLLAALLLDLVTLLGFISWNWYSFVFFFFLTQASNTLTICTTLIYMTEITTIDHRSTLFVKFGIFYLSGFAYICIFGYFLLTPQWWRYTAVVVYVPCLVAVGLYCCWSRETLQYLWARREGEKLEEVVDWMGRENNGEEFERVGVEEYINGEEGRNGEENRGNQDGLGREEVSKVDKSSTQEKLFGDKYRGITIRLMIGRLCTIFVYNGMTLFLPTILAQLLPKTSSNRLLEYTFYLSMCLIQMSTYLIGPSFINHPHIGRKITTYWTFGIIMLASVMCICLVGFGVFPLLLASIVIKAANSINQTAFNLYSNELYEPLIRGKAQMAINMLARLTMIFLGGAGLVTLQFLNGRGVFVLFGAISLAATVAMYTMPYCTSNPKA